MVTVAILKENGYPVGNLKDDAQVALAERAVTAAYFPTGETFETEAAKQLLYALTYSMLLKRKTVLTRFGSAEKTSQYTIAADNDQIKAEIRGYCRQPLESYFAGSDFDPEDILEIYTKIYLN